MSFTIRYASRRKDVWRFYWRTWRRRLWPLHLTIYLATCVFASLRVEGGWPRSLAAFTFVALTGLIPILVLVAYPMVRFKPQTRVLTVDELGIVTFIGKKKGFVPWAQIARVREEEDALVVQRTNMNAFIIPARAFEDEAAKDRFRAFVLAQVGPHAV